MVIYNLRPTTDISFFNIQFAIIYFRRSSWRVISTIEQKEEDMTEEQQDHIKSYRTNIEQEINNIVTEVNLLLDKYLIKNAPDAESKVRVISSLE